MKICFAFLAVLALSACDVFDKEETIPSFILINSADLVTDLDQGANTNGIVDATVFADGVFVGTFELPAVVPILQNGQATITVAAGVKNNGLSQDRIIYPFYNFTVREINLIPDAKIPFTADTTVTFAYFDNILNFEIEDFEDVGSDLIPFDESNAFINRSNDVPEIPAMGESLEITLTPDSTVFYVATNWALQNLPKGNNMYFEIDFKGDHPLEIGILALNSTTVQKVFALGILPTNEWTKVYVDLTNEISQQVNTNNFAIYLESRSSPFDGEKRIYIDNLKFVYP